MSMKDENLINRAALAADLSEILQKHVGADHYDTIANMTNRIYELENRINFYKKELEKCKSQNQ